MYREMRIVLIREAEPAGAIEVAFSESARFYRLLRRNRKFERVLCLLQEAKREKRPVRVLLDSAEGEVIEDVQPSSPV